MAMETPPPDDSLGGARRNGYLEHFGRSRKT